jgi:hypothetical protein
MGNAVAKGEAVLYARCAYCGYTAPLNCSGQFMPHPTVLVSLTGMGPTCPMCGPLPPVFTCPFFHQQYLYIPGVSPTPQQGYTYAPVVQAQPGASPSSLKSQFRDLVGNLGEHIGKGAVDAMFGQLS